jgi:hypothetical protein
MVNTIGVGIGVAVAVFVIVGVAVGRGVFDGGISLGVGEVVGE